MGGLMDRSPECPALFILVRAENALYFRFLSTRCIPRSSDRELVTVHSRTYHSKEPALR